MHTNKNINMAGNSTAHCCC